MHVEATKARCRQHRRRQNQAIGGDNRGVGAEIGKFLCHSIVAQSRWGPHLDSVPLGQQLHRRRLQAMPPPGRARRLGVHRTDAVAGRDQRVEHGRGKWRRPKKDKVHRSSNTGWPAAPDHDRIGSKRTAIRPDTWILL
jgi:hypothetical protein